MRKLTLPDIEQTMELLRQADNSLQLKTKNQRVKDAHKNIHIAWHLLNDEREARRTPPL